MTRRANDETKPTVLVTGGAGYIGSHCVLLLLEQNYHVIVIDNCSNTYVSNDTLDDNGNLQDKPESLRRVEELTGKQLGAFYKIDLANERDTSALDAIFLRHNIRVVLHFAAFKSVNESIERPLEYYTNNIGATINLLNTMQRHQCKRLIFSSSATVYGLPEYLPVDESHPVGRNILNPYGRSKFMIEQILMDLCHEKANNKTTQPTSNGNGHQQHRRTTTNWNIIALRYFNPTGAHPSGYIGEHTNDLPNNLMPYISQVSVKKRDRLYVFGNDFDTPDGTGVRDFIHIMDLASGHLHALDFLLRQEALQVGVASPRYRTYNLGTGRGYSVLEIIKTYEQVNNVKIPYEITKRREGDAGSVYADASLARNELGWSAKYSIVEMVRDIHRWQSAFPDGFKSKKSLI